MKIADVKKKFKNKWVLAKVLEENELNQPIEVKPLAASYDRNEIYKKITDLPKGTAVATFYTGKARGVFVFYVRVSI